MANKQPFYHEFTVLLTGVGVAFSEQQIIRALKKGLGRDARDIEIEDYQEPEPGDPADLM